jgi:hypothetical protein
MITFVVLREIGIAFHKLLPADEIDDQTVGGEPVPAGGFSPLNPYFAD